MLILRILSENHTITKCLKLTGTFRYDLIITLCDSMPKWGHPELIPQDHVQTACEYLQGWSLHNLSGQSVLMFHHTHNKEVFYDVLILFQFVPIASHPDTERNSSLFSLYLPFRHLYTLMKHPLRAFRRVNSPRTLILSSSERCYCTIVTFVALHSTVSINPCLPCSGKPRTSIAGVASSLLGRGEGLSPFTSFAARVHCWLMINLVSIRTPRCFSPKLLSRWVAPGMPTPCTGKFCFINVLFESENLISTPTPPPNPQICGDCFVVIFFFFPENWHRSSAEIFLQTVFSWSTREIRCYFWSSEISSCSCKSSR